ncbi:hypothetical protein B0H14DRAFT_2588379 [Mycena olivaceomarginata]|nr:hypothetical protein B0H14DRAFT_2588379 [Mycena olivaceomarginata]
MFKGGHFISVHRGPFSFVFSLSECDPENLLSSLSSQLYAPTRSTSWNWATLTLLKALRRSEAPDFAMGKLEFRWRPSPGNTISFLALLCLVDLDVVLHMLNRQLLSSLRSLGISVGGSIETWDVESFDKDITRPSPLSIFSALSLCSAVTRWPTVCCAHVDRAHPSSRVGIHRRHEDRMVGTGAKVQRDRPMGGKIKDELGCRSQQKSTKWDSVAVAQVHVVGNLPFSSALQASWDAPDFTMSKGGGT